MPATTLQRDQLGSVRAITRVGAGGVPEVIEKLRRIEALGYDEFSLWIDSGMSFARKRASLERFIADVMPAFA